MIPVELRLTNFMSYGTRAPSLDFGLFHVACLSGRNGQGKSALLDAITWALWGEARKSSGSHKPDDELVRIGAREMAVELVFDLEGERYRVSRSYVRSATGKTSKPGLELQVYDPDTDGFRPLTGPSIRETQETLDKLLGIDYDTFINSAFLLQGRSDEFTKKKPSERKEILARILNLERYERLADRARDRENEARERLERTEIEMERLRQALEDEPVWKEERAQVDADLAEARVRSEALRVEEQACTERLAALDACAREASGIRESLDTLAERQAQHEEDARVLRERIEEAEVLLAQREQITRDYDRYEALQREREQLDLKRDIHGGLESQLQKRESELKDRRNELEKRLHTLEVELRSSRLAHDECSARLVELPALRRRLERAHAARQRVEAMQAVLEKRKALDDELARLERELVGLREALAGQYQALEDQIRRDAAALPDVAELERRQRTLTARAGELRSVQEQIETVRKQGQEVAEAIKEREGLVSVLRQEREKEEEALQNFRALDGATCPTCGAGLTPQHRREVEGKYHATLAAIDRRIEEAESWIREQSVRRNELRAAYRELQLRIEQLGAAHEELATLTEQLRLAQDGQRALAERRREAEALKKQLDDKAYGEPQRQRYRMLTQERSALAFDEAAYERLREEAVEVSHLESQLRDLEQVAGKQEQLTRTVAQLERQEATLRAELSDGSAFRPIQQQIDQLREQIARNGFDPRRFDEVRQNLRDLAQAGARMKDLVHAQQNHAEWKVQLENVRQRLCSLTQERTALMEKLVRVEAELSERPAVEAAQRELQSRRTALDAELHALQLRLGELKAKLAQAERDREALKECREKHTAAQAERALYRHLRTAFGRHGIPSLIIEHTLPEIEERANVILDRLTDGRMHVRLETLKDKKSGGTKETLEIILTDEQGVPRAYETFSGGEAFRVNFALRIALAQLLAERSGVRVRTLVIDEGFGTQDALGVQSMVEAIQAIQDDFDKIIVITHLSELKDAFPVRIEVEKDPVDGSSFEVLGV